MRVFLTVGIGASAGGLDAFTRFLSATAPDTGMAYVLVQHLSPDHKSVLAELLNRTTQMTVEEASDGAEVKPNCVLVIPPDATMTIQNGRLSVVRPAPPRDRRRPIDSFFQSLAEDQGERAICIILAGTGSDGSLGLTAVKENGGLTLAQAEYDSHALPGMPQSAADTGLVDEVLAVEDMPARILLYRDHLTKVADGKDEDGLRTDAGESLAAILRMLQSRSGHDFSEYKEKTLRRRLQRRMQVLHLETPEDYRRRIAEHPEELDALLRELLIGVTQFFRDPPAFDALDAEVLQRLARERGADEDIRIWAPGCATGEEAYSLAILLHEALEGRKGSRPRVQIFGTDIDERAIGRARLGRYRKPVAGLSAERAERWFRSEGDECVIAPEIRAMCIFSVHSLIKHPPFSRLDLISCRNLLIYLDPKMQDRVMRNFHYGLSADGNLFLGSSESVTRAARLFSVVDKKHRIFRRSNAPSGPLPVGFYPGRVEAPGAAPPSDATTTDAMDRSIRRMMETHTPPHLVVDRSNQIIRFSGGSIGPFLEPSPGSPSFGVFDMLRKALRPALREVLQQARGETDPVRRDDVPVQIDGRPRLVSLVAERLSSEKASADLVLLTIVDAGAAPGRQMGDEPGASVQALEHELRTTRIQLQSTIEELESANEEMKSANEEFQSVNEELQSSNEELETAKEEMQSVNEELQTINGEIVGKNELLTQLNSDLSNLLESTDIATLFLDDQLRVRRFSLGVGGIFHLRAGDIGRPITDIVSLLHYDDLQNDVKQVLRTLAPVEREVTLAGEAATFILRIRHYRTTDNVIDGVVLTFIDISERQAAGKALRASELRFRMLFDQIDEGFCTLEKLQTAPGEPSDYRYMMANPGFEQQSGVRDVVGRTLREVLPQQDATWFATYDQVMETGVAQRFERELAPNGRVLEAFAFRLDDGSSSRLGVISLDVTERVLHQDQQELLLREMDHRIKNLFAIAGGVVSLSARGAASPGEMATAIHGRLGALSAAHELVRPHRSGGGALTLRTTIAELIAAVLKPYVGAGAQGEHERTVIEGPEVSVGGEAVTSLAMVLHELATNAAKYGAFSTPAGQVRVTWVCAGSRLELIWTEHGGPKVAGPPAREGFGSLLARRSLSAHLKGEIVNLWRPDGLEVRLSVAMERLDH